jgi:predicted nucleotidyltransferase
MKPLNPTPRQKEKILTLISAQLDRHNEIRFACCHGSFMEDGLFHDIDIAIFLEPDFLSEINFRYEMQMEAKLEKALNITAAVDSAYTLQEPVSAYSSDFDGKIGALRAESRLLYDVFADI